MRTSAENREAPVKTFRRGFVCFVSAACMVFLGAALLMFNEEVPGHAFLKRELLARLTAVGPQQDVSSGDGSRTDAVLYILGGTQASLAYKFNKAAELYRQGRCCKILLYREAGITEYDAGLNRNLTNDEWAVRSLTARGVPATAVEPAVKGEGYLGTYTEAKKLLVIAKKRGYRRIILVTSSYHSGRTWMTFAKILKAQGVTISISSADEPVELSGLVYEYLKLLLYKTVILPHYSGQLERGQTVAPVACLHALPNAAGAITAPLSLRLSSYFPGRIDLCRSLQNNTFPAAGQGCMRPVLFRDYGQLSMPNRHTTMFRNTVYRIAGP